MAILLVIERYCMVPRIIGSAFVVRQTTMLFVVRTDPSSTH
ncbi:hypothetical protein SMA75_20335 [Escherichia coli]